MTHISGFERSQLLLLPEAVDDYVGADNPVRLIDAFVDGLDLFGCELLAVDGTHITALNNKDRNFTTGSLQKFIAAVDKKLEDYLKRLDAGDAEERATGGSLSRIWRKRSRR